MTKDAKRALRERLADDSGFKEYMAEVQAALQKHLDTVVMSAPGAVSEAALRETIGQLRAIRTLSRDLLGVESGRD